MWASVGRPFLLPPTYFCTSSIFEAGTKIFRVAVKLEHQVLFGLVPFFEQLQAAVAADAVRQVDDVVAFAQLEKAVDHAAQPPPRGAVQIGPVKQLAAADQRDALADQAKAGLQPAERVVQLAGLRPARVGPKTSCSRCDSASVWQTMNTSCAAPPPIAASSSSRTLAMSPLNRSTDSIGRWQVVSSEPTGTLAAVTEGKRWICRSVLLSAVGILRPFEPLQIAAAFFFDVARLDQVEPASLGQIAGKVLAVAVAAAGERDVDLIERRQAPLRGDLEAADRFDLVAEELDPHRVEPVGGEDVEDAAARRELARQFDGGGVLKAAPAPARRAAPGRRASRRARKRRVGWAMASRLGTGCSRL